MTNVEQRERELRRRARIAKAAPEVEPPAAPQLPRRRAAFVAHADRDSLASAIVLARDLRLVEGFWVYPQADLMTFFRSVATDLRGETPIYLVGFTATPARDTIGAAALYAGRIAWFDHHDWPPEDLESLRLAIGKENVHVQPGAGSSLPLVLDVRSRRSRFSDKLVELVTARFSLHDHERWGRVWWQRLAELAARPGDKRAAVEPLLVGRPSDLAHEAERAARDGAAARGRLRGRPRLPRRPLRRLHARRGPRAARPRSAPRRRASRASATRRSSRSPTRKAASWWC